ncbi:MAG: hypothetical protein JST80_02140 [Bdellovibrionales bacterium]|nr:hypothetical protein [Bdellovibrionales bacterium]
MNSRFYFACCQFGAEKVVKAEVLERYPHLRFAFSRPGFITFKEEDADKCPLIKKFDGIFVRLWGESLAQAKAPEALAGLLDKIPSGAVVHAFERDTFIPGDDPLGFVVNARIPRVELPVGARLNAAPKPGERVYDLIWLDDKTPEGKTEMETHIFLGSHEHHAGLDPAPGNKPSIELPKTAPSRAYLKLAEAVKRFQIPVKAGQGALEVGASPGGATHYMLEQGMGVLGVDPKTMAPAVREHPKFRYVQKPGKATTAEDLSQFNPDWLVVDMNIAPLEAIDEIGHVVRLLRKNYGKNLALKRAFITLKLNDWKFTETIPLYLKRLQELGFRELKPMQLASNRQEIFVMARSFS